MSWILLAAALLLGLFLLLRVLVSANPHSLAQALRVVAVGVGIMGAVGLIYAGRLNLLLALGAGVAPLVLRWWRGRAARKEPSAGRVSRVETLFLRMTLDHDSGVLSGEVLRGSHRGRTLESLDRAEVMDLLRTCGREDGDSVPVLESWLDRCRPGWRNHPDPDGPPSQDAGDGGPMTREEAAAILGLDADATKEQIKDAHHRLMMKNHPDHGGSTYLAAKINQAKDVMLHP